MEIKRSSSSGSDQLLSEDVVRKCVDLGRDEFVHHSSVIWKINQRGKPQKRNLLITNFAVYNLTPTVFGGLVCRRKIDITAIQNIFVCLFTNEFVLHVKDEYDYKFKHENTGAVVKVILELYEEIAKEQGLARPTIMMIEVDSSMLDSFMVRKNSSIDSRRGVEANIYLYINRPRQHIKRMPLEGSTGLVLNGVRIKDVVPNSAGSLAELRSGMIISEIEGEPVPLNSSGNAVKEMLDSFRELAIKRANECLRIRVYATNWKGIGNVAMFQEHKESSSTQSAMSSSSKKKLSTSSRSIMKKLSTSSRSIIKDTSRSVLKTKANKRKKKKDWDPEEFNPFPTGGSCDTSSVTAQTRHTSSITRGKNPTSATKFKVASDEVDTASWDPEKFEPFRKQRNGRSVQNNGYPVDPSTSVNTTTPPITPNSSGATSNTSVVPKSLDWPEILLSKSHTGKALLEGPRGVLREGKEPRKGEGFPTVPYSGTAGVFGSTWPRGGVKRSSRTPTATIRAQTLKRMPSNSSEDVKKLLSP
ncbi:hypothetical protein AAMO2058_000714400 [Amorphochlora amoebiformis]